MESVPYDKRSGKIWFNGKTVDWKDANIHILNHGLHYASCVFEGERVYDGEIFKLEEHTERLFYSAKRMGIEVPFSQKAKASHPAPFARSAPRVQSPTPQYSSKWTSKSLSESSSLRLRRSPSIAPSSSDTRSRASRSSALSSITLVSRSKEAVTNGALNGFVSFKSSILHRITRSVE